MAAKILSFRKGVYMGSVSLLSGITLLVVGLVIWKLEMVELLAGYESKRSVDKPRLAKKSGLSLPLLGLVLLVESFLVFKGVLTSEKAIFVVFGTIIIGVLIVAVVVSRYSED